MIKKYFALLFLFCLSSFIYAQSIEDKLVNRLVNYASKNTQSDEDSNTFPSSKSQTELAELLKQELESLGVKKVEIDDNSYLYATIPGNVENAPTIFLSAHLDTSPDGKMQEDQAPKPVVHKYNGGDLVINEKLNLVLTPEKNEFLAEAAGGMVITSDGTTLLGGDDKAGMSIVMTLAETLTNNPNIPHGDIRILFTPDEEIGNSTSRLTKKDIAADFGLVLDSHGFGRLLVGNFNAIDFTFFVRAIPGFEAYSEMPGPYRIATNFMANFPKAKSAYNSTGMQGYMEHNSNSVDEGFNEYLVRGRLRSFDLSGEMQEYKNLVQKWAQETAEEAIKKYEAKGYNMKYITVINGEASGNYTNNDLVVVLTMKDSYFNAKYVLEKYPTNFALLQEAYSKAGVTMIPESGRGGSDAGDITYLGIPTYNMFTGSHNEHSPNEWVSSKQMLASYNVALNYIQLMAKQDRTAMLREGNPRYMPQIPIPAMINFDTILKELQNKYGNPFSDR